MSSKEKIKAAKLKAKLGSAKVAGSPPKFSKVLPPTHIQKVGTEMELEVIAEDCDQVIFRWEKPSYTDGEGERIQFLDVDANKSLCRVSPVQIQDEGDWRCSLEDKKSGETFEESCCALVIYVPKSYRIPNFLEELEAKVSSNGTVALECKVIGVPTPRLLWFKDDKELKSGDSYELKAENNTDSTVYKCVAINCVGSAMSEAILKFRNSQNVAPPKVSVGLNDVRVKIGSDLEFYIKVNEESLPCEISWYHNDLSVHSSANCLLQNVKNEFKLILRDICLENDGLWRAEISNDLGICQDECRVTLKVPKNYRPPVFVEKLKANLTDEGLVSFECKVIGFPTPVLSWMKDGIELRPGDVYQLYGNQSIGVYTCVAKNCMGEARSTSSLTVEDLEKKPKKSVEILMPLKDIDIKYGESCQLSIQVSTNLQLPYVWRKNGKEVGFPEYIIGCEEDGKYFCNIVNATKEDEGTWECILEEEEEYLSSMGSVKVVIPRHFKAPKFLEDLRVFLGENGNVSLECKVIGIPQPTLTWFKDEKELRAGDLHQLMTGSDSGNDPKQCIFGTYKCLAENCMAEASSSATLIGFGSDEDSKGSTLPEEDSKKSIIEDDVVKPDILDEIDVSVSLGADKSVMLSLSDVPDISAENAQQIVEMFAQELAESISDDDMVELPPLRFVRETSKSDKVKMEAVVIDIDEQELEEAENIKSTMEDVDETVADVDELSDGSWNSGEGNDMLDVDINDSGAGGLDDSNMSLKQLVPSKLRKDEEEMKVADMIEVNDLILEEKNVSMSHVNKDLWNMIKTEAEKDKNKEFIDEIDHESLALKENFVNEQEIAIQNEVSVTKIDEREKRIEKDQNKPDKVQAKEEINTEVAKLEVKELENLIATINYDEVKLSRKEPSEESSEVKNDVKMESISSKEAIQAENISSEKIPIVEEDSGMKEGIPLQVSSLSHKTKDASDVQTSSEKEFRGDEPIQSTQEILSEDVIHSNEKQSPQTQISSRITEKIDELDISSQQISPKEAIRSENIKESPEIQLSSRIAEKIDENDISSQQMPSKETKTSKDTEESSENQTLLEKVNEIDQCDEAIQQNSPLQNIIQSEKLNESTEKLLNKLDAPSPKVSKHIEKGDMTKLPQQETRKIGIEIEQTLKENSVKMEKLTEDTISSAKDVSTLDQKFEAKEAFPEVETPKEKEVKEGSSDGNLSDLLNKNVEINEVSDNINGKNITLDEANKRNSFESELDDEQEDDIEFKLQKRRSSSYEDTLKNMDPDILRELGLSEDLIENIITPFEDEVKSTNGAASDNDGSDLSSRVEEKAKELIKDIVPVGVRRSRSRSRSRSKPPSLDTVEENYSAEYQEALYYKTQLPDIKESPSCSSVPSHVTEVRESFSASSLASMEVAHNSNQAPEHFEKKNEETLLLDALASALNQAPTVSEELYQKLLKTNVEETDLLANSGSNDPLILKESQLIQMSSALEKSILDPDLAKDEATFQQLQKPHLKTTSLMQSKEKEIKDTSTSSDVPFFEGQHEVDALRQQITQMLSPLDKVPEHKLTSDEVQYKQELKQKLQHLQAYQQAERKCGDISLQSTDDITQNKVTATQVNDDDGNFMEVDESSVKHAKNIGNDGCDIECDFVENDVLNTVQSDSQHTKLPVCTDVNMPDTKTTFEVQADNLTTDLKVDCEPVCLHGTVLDFKESTRENQVDTEFVDEISSTDDKVGEVVEIRVKHGSSVPAQIDKGEMKAVDVDIRKVDPKSVDDGIQTPVMDDNEISNSNEHSENNNKEKKSLKGKLSKKAGILTSLIKGKPSKDKKSENKEKKDSTEEFVKAKVETVNSNNSASAKKTNKISENPPKKGKGPLSGESNERMVTQNREQDKELGHEVNQFENDTAEITSPVKEVPQSKCQELVLEKNSNSQRQKTITIGNITKIEEDKVTIKSSSQISLEEKQILEKDYSLQTVDNAKKHPSGNEDFDLKSEKTVNVPPQRSSHLENVETAIPSKEFQDTMANSEPTQSHGVLKENEQITKTLALDEDNIEMDEDYSSCSDDASVTTVEDFVVRNSLVLRDDQIESLFPLDDQSLDDNVIQNHANNEMSAKVKAECRDLSEENMRYLEESSKMQKPCKEGIELHQKDILDFKTPKAADDMSSVEKPTSDNENHHSRAKMAKSEDFPEKTDISVSNADKTVIEISTNEFEAKGDNSSLETSNKDIESNITEDVNKDVSASKFPNQPDVKQIKSVNKESESCISQSDSFPNKKLIGINSVSFESETAQEHLQVNAKLNLDQKSESNTLKSGGSIDSSQIKSNLVDVTEGKILSSETVESIPKSIPLSFIESKQDILKSSAEEQFKDVGSASDQESSSQNLEGELILEDGDSILESKKRHDLMLATPNLQKEIIDKPKESVENANEKVYIAVDSNVRAMLKSSSESEPVEIMMENKVPIGLEDTGSVEQSKNSDNFKTYRLSIKLPNVEGISKEGKPAEAEIEMITETCETSINEEEILEYSPDSVIKQGKNMTNLDAPETSKKLQNIEGSSKETSKPIKAEVEMTTESCEVSPDSHESPKHTSVVSLKTQIENASDREETDALMKPQNIEESSKEMSKSIKGEVEMTPETYDVSPNSHESSKHVSVDSEKKEIENTIDLEETDALTKPQNVERNSKETSKPIKAEVEMTPETYDVSPNSHESSKHVSVDSARKEIENTSDLEETDSLTKPQNFEGRSRELSKSIKGEGEITPETFEASLNSHESSKQDSKKPNNLETTNVLKLPQDAGGSLKEISKSIKKEINTTPETIGNNYEILEHAPDSEKRQSKNADNHETVQGLENSKNVEESPKISSIPIKEEIEITPEAKETSSNFHETIDQISEKPNNLERFNPLKIPQDVKGSPKEISKPMKSEIEKRPETCKTSENDREDFEHAPDSAMDQRENADNVKTAKAMEKSKNFEGSPEESSISIGAEVEKTPDTSSNSHEIPKHNLNSVAKEIENTKNLKTAQDLEKCSNVEGIPEEGSTSIETDTEMMPERYENFSNSYENTKHYPHSAAKQTENANNLETGEPLKFMHVERSLKESTIEAKTEIMTETVETSLNSHEGPNKYVSSSALKQVDVNLETAKTWKKSEDVGEIPKEISMSKKADIELVLEGCKTSTNDHEILEHASDSALKQSESTKNLDMAEALKKSQSVQGSPKEMSSSITSQVEMVPKIFESCNNNQISQEIPKNILDLSSNQNEMKSFEDSLEPLKVPVKNVYESEIDDRSSQKFEDNLKEMLNIQEEMLPTAHESKKISQKRLQMTSDSLLLQDKSVNHHETLQGFQDHPESMKEFSASIIPQIDIDPSTGSSLIKRTQMTSSKKSNSIRQKHDVHVESAGKPRKPDSFANKVEVEKCEEVIKEEETSSRIDVNISRQHFNIENAESCSEKTSQLQHNILDKVKPSIGAYGEAEPEDFYDLSSEPARKIIQEISEENVFGTSSNLESFINQNVPSKSDNTLPYQNDKTLSKTGIQPDDIGEAENQDASMRQNDRDIIKQVQNFDVIQQGKQHKLPNETDVFKRPDLVPFKKLDSGSVTDGAVEALEEHQVSSDAKIIESLDSGHFGKAVSELLIDENAQISKEHSASNGDKTFHQDGLEPISEKTLGSDGVDAASRKSKVLAIKEEVQMDLSEEQYNEKWKTKEEDAMVNDSFSSKASINAITTKQMESQPEFPEESKIKENVQESKILTSTEKFKEGSGRENSHLRRSHSRTKSPDKKLRPKRDSSMNEQLVATKKSLLKPPSSPNESRKAKPKSSTLHFSSNAEKHEEKLQKDFKSHSANDDRKIPLTKDESEQANDYTFDSNKSPWIDTGETPTVAYIGDMKSNNVKSESDKSMKVEDVEKVEKEIEAPEIFVEDNSEIKCQTNDSIVRKEPQEKVQLSMSNGDKITLEEVESAHNVKKGSIIHHSLSPKTTLLMGTRIPRRGLKSAALDKVSDSHVNVHEIGPDWVSLSWKKPDSKSGKISQILTYKVESWLCGEGAYWVEVGRSPIPQFDVFNLKPQRQYYFRVTAKSRKGTEFELMTKGKVDLSKSTLMPTFTKQMTNFQRVLKGDRVKLECEYTGEPKPDVRWIHTRNHPKIIEATNETNNSSCYEIESIAEKDSGKYCCEIANISGRISSFSYVDVVSDEKVFQSYTRAKNIMEGTKSLDEETFPCFLVAPRDRRIEYGCPIQFMCKPLGLPPPKVTWFKEGIPIESSDSIHVSGKDGYLYLSFDAVNEDDTGHYEAVAANEIGQVTSKFTLVVDEGPNEHFAPQFSAPLKNEPLKPNVNMLLRTKIAASPTVSVNWFRNGCKIRSSNKVHKHVDNDGNATLAMVDIDCSGQYTCVAFNEGGENSASIHVEPAVIRDEGALEIFKSPPQVGQTKTNGLEIKCKLSQVGEVFFSNIPTLNATKLRQFTKMSDNNHKLELAEDDENCGKISYVIAKSLGQTFTYPIWTDVKSKEKNFSLTQKFMNPLKKIKERSKVNSELTEAFCRTGDKMSLGLGIIDKALDDNAIITLTKKDKSNVNTRPSFVLNKDEFEVLFKNVKKEDEGIYDVEVKDRQGNIKAFSYILIVMDNNDHEQPYLLDTADKEMQLLSPSSARMRSPSFWTPRVSPYNTPRATPTPRTTPVRNTSPQEDEEPRQIKSLISPKIISGLSDLTTTHGSTGEIKCYVLTTPGLTTYWEKDGKRLSDSGNERFRTFETRGVRRLTIRNVKEQDSGTYAMRIIGPGTNLFSQCRISVVGRNVSAGADRVKSFMDKMKMKDYRSLRSYTSSRYMSRTSYW